MLSIRSFWIFSTPLILSACAASPGGMLEQRALETYNSAKAPIQVSDCLSQSLRGEKKSGNDGSRYWLTRENAYGTVVRFDFIANPSGGTIVEYRSRLKINNGLDKLRGCL